MLSERCGIREGMRPLGRPRRRQKGDIKIEVNIRCYGVDWIQLAEYMVR
jgi:hypothetical protein